MQAGRDIQYTPLDADEDDRGRMELCFPAKSPPRFSGPFGFAQKIGARLPRPESTLFSRQIVPAPLEDRMEHRRTDLAVFAKDDHRPSIHAISAARQQLL